MTHAWWFIDPQPPIPEEPRMTQPEQTDKPRGRTLPGVPIPDEVKIQACRSCGHAIWWGTTLAGKRCPFDVEHGQPTTITHFSTCPQARSWTKR